MGLMVLFCLTENVYSYSDPKGETILILVKKDFSQKEEIEKYIIEVAERYQIDGQIFLKVAKCESLLDATAYGDKRIGGSYGIWQIYKPSHPEITYEQAIDIEWSTEWAAKEFKEGRAWKWSCYKKITKSSKKTSI